MHYIIIKHNGCYIYAAVCTYIRFSSDYCEIFCGNDDIALNLHKILFLSNHNHTKINNRITVNRNIFTITQVTEKAFVFEFTGSKATRFKSYTFRHINYFRVINNYINESDAKDDDAIGDNIIQYVKNLFYEKCENIANKDIKTAIDDLFEGISEAIVNSRYASQYMNYIVNHVRDIVKLDLKALKEYMSLEDVMLSLGYRK